MRLVRKSSLLFLAVALSWSFSSAAQTTAAAATTTKKTFDYPAAKKVDQTDDYHGTKVADPYRWLEDTDSPDTKAWVAEENKLTFGFLEQISERAWIKDRLTKMWNFERNGVPFKEGGRYFFTRNSGLQNQSVLYTMPSLSAEPRVLLDPNTFSKDGTVALAGMSVSQDGKLLAYGVSTSGSDWAEWKVRDVKTGKDLPDDIKWVKFSRASWTRDSKGFFYSRFDEPKEAALRGANYYHKVYFHRLGTPQSEDALVYDRPDEKEMTFYGSVTDDGRFLLIGASKKNSDKNALYYKDLTQKNAKVVRLLDDFDAQYEPVDNDGPLLWIKTDLDAPRYRVIAIDTRHPERANWKEVIPQAAENLDSVGMIDNQFVASYLKDAHTQIRIFDVNGKPVREVELPGIGTVGGFSGKRTDKETFYAFTSFTNPATIYHYDMVDGKSTLFRKPKVDFNADAYETRQIFYTSKDGTRVPMFITCRKGLQLDGNNPTLMYAYGGFNIPITPGFSPRVAAWLEMGGVYAVPNLRGGGEYGQEWHQQGMKLKKQNVFDDFIAAAQWLIDNKYTSTRKLAINGGSNGGLLMGAMVTQRPDLWGAVVADVGVMDMLRFHKFTIGWAWVADYGSSDNPDEFKALYAYSPLHNIKPGTAYPPTLITTADHDDRVVPGHSFKFAATLQEAQAGPAPVLIRIETKAGHGGGKPTWMQIEEATDMFGFIVKELDVKLPGPTAIGGSR